ncbi:MAG: GNAT family N-acetyltransferase [Sporomusaceae bacterium]|nr:GNAT family N-acetyltransferase [Sporomusaceae bacterium]
MTAQEVVIRPITAADIAGVQAFLLQQLKTLFNHDGQAALTDDVWGLAKTYLEPADCNMWAAFSSAGEVLATAAICRYNDRIMVLKGRYSLPETAEVGRCYVDERLRRQGIGSRLLEHMVDFCRQQDYRIMYLHTHHFLPGGFNFWKKQGFAITIDEGGPAEIVHMEKSL